MGGKFGCNFVLPAPPKWPQPKAIITIVIMKLKLWPAVGCEAKVAAELSFCPFVIFFSEGPATVQR